VAQQDELVRALPADGYSDRDRYADYRAVFGTPQGKRVLADILRECHFWVSTDRGEDTHATAFLNGKRDLGLWLADVVATEPVAQPATADSE
jgi:hypothetical protein